MHDLARDNLAKTTVTEGGLFLPLVGRAQAPAVRTSGLNTTSRRRHT
jgi:hypothetical protein